MALRDMASSSRRPLGASPPLRWCRRPLSEPDRPPTTDAQARRCRSRPCSAERRTTSSLRETLAGQSPLAHHPPKPWPRLETQTSSQCLRPDIEPVDELLGRLLGRVPQTRDIVPTLARPPKLDQNFHSHAGTVTMASIEDASPCPEAQELEPDRDARCREAHRRDAHRRQRHRAVDVHAVHPRLNP